MNARRTATRAAAARYSLALDSRDETQIAEALAQLLELVQ